MTCIQDTVGSDVRVCNCVRWLVHHDAWLTTRYISLFVHCFGPVKMPCMWTMCIRYVCDLSKYMEINKIMMFITMVRCRCRCHDAIIIIVAVAVPAYFPDFIKYVRKRHTLRQLLNQHTKQKKTKNRQRNLHNVTHSMRPTTFLQYSSRFYYKLICMWNLWHVILMKGTRSIF